MKHTGEIGERPSPHRSVLVTGDEPAAVAGEGNRGDVVHEADERLYEAKRSGRNRVIG